jgi:hypothetical protein
MESLLFLHTESIIDFFMKSSDSNIQKVILKLKKDRYCVVYGVKINFQHALKPVLRSNPVDYTIPKNTHPLCKS